MPHKHAASLCSYISLHHCRAAQRQDRNTQPSLLQPRHVMARLEGQTEPRRALRPSPRDVWKHEPTHSRAGRCLVPAGGYWTIRHALLCTVTKSLSPSYRVTPTTDLCVLFLFVPCLIIARQSGLSRLHLWYPWNVRPSSAVATYCCSS